MKKCFGVLAAMLMAIAGTTFLARPARAQSGAELQPGVARVSLIHGDVSMQRGDSGDWVVVTLNTPLVAGDRISTGNGSRAEVQLDYANVIRLDENTTVKIADLTRTHIQVQVGQGLVNYSVFKDSQADSEIDTPNVAVHPLRQGDYRIEVPSDSESQLIVRKGDAEVSVPQGTTRVEQGQLITIQGTSNPEYQTISAPRKDDFDKWNSERDHVIQDARSWQRTDRYYTGSEDLDAYGHWRYVPDYGWVWVPVEGPGWAPYRDGSWVWEPYYGWTWVSYEPWGWAPYHYGRWFFYGGYWGWWPGPVVAYPAYYPIWAPAYVSFFGFGYAGGNFAFGFGFGNIGWLPIGPADPFFPWFGRGLNRVNIVNVTNITNITNITNVRNINNGRVFPVPPLFRGPASRGFSNLRSVENNPRILSAVSSMPANQFGRGPAPTRPQPVTPAMFRQGSLMTGRLPVVPTRESLRPVDKPVPPAMARIESAGNKHFFTKSQSAPTPKPFAEQAAQVQRMIADSRAQLPSAKTSNRVPAPAPPRQTGKAGQQNSFPASRPIPAPAAHYTQTRRFSAPASAQRQADVRPGWRRFGDGDGSSLQGWGPAGQKKPNAASRPSDSHPSGWHSFSEPAQSQNGNRQAEPPRQFPNRAQRQSRAASAPAKPQAPPQREGGWQHFTPPSPQESRPAPRGSTLPVPVRTGRQSSSSGPSRGQPGRGFASPRQGWSLFSRNSARNSYRPPLDLGQPVVTRRSPSYSDRGPQRGFEGGARRDYSRPRGGDSGGGFYDRSSGGSYSRSPGGSYGGPSGGFRGGGYRGAPSGGHGSSRGSSHSSDRGRH